MQPAAKLQAEVHLKKEKGKKKSKWHANVLIIFLIFILLVFVLVATISAVNWLKGSSQLSLTPQQWELLLAQVSVSAAAFWLSVERSGWFSVCLAHHPVGIRTLQYCVHVSVQMSGQRCFSSVYGLCMSRMNCIYVFLCLRGCADLQQG